MATSDKGKSDAPAVAPAQPASVPPMPAQKLDETIPGGSFIVNGKRVNAEGQRIHEDGTLLTAEELAAEGA